MRLTKELRGHFFRTIVVTALAKEDARTTKLHAFLNSVYMEWYNSTVKKYEDTAVFPYLYALDKLCVCLKYDEHTLDAATSFDLPPQTDYSGSTFYMPRAVKRNEIRGNKKGYVVRTNQDRWTPTATFVLSDTQYAEYLTLKTASDTHEKDILELCKFAKSALESCNTYKQLKDTFPSIAANTNEFIDNAVQSEILRERTRKAARANKKGMKTVPDNFTGTEEDAAKFQQILNKNAFMSKT